MVRVRVAPLSLTVTPCSVGSGPDAGARLVDDGRHHLGALEQGRPGRRGASGHQAVEVVAGDGVAVVGEVGVSGQRISMERPKP